MLESLEMLHSALENLKGCLWGSGVRWCLWLSYLTVNSSPRLICASRQCIFGIAFHSDVVVACLWDGLFYSLWHAVLKGLFLCTWSNGKCREKKTPASHVSVSCLISQSAGQFSPDLQLCLRRAVLFWDPHIRSLCPIDSTVYRLWTLVELSTWLRTTE